MKKRFWLLPLSLTPLSATAIDLVDYQPSGTKVELWGSLRVHLIDQQRKTEDADGTNRQHRPFAFANGGSRFGFRLTQQLGNDWALIANSEWRWRGTSNSRHDFDDIFTRQLYAGIRHKQYGELVYGNMLTITDEVRQTDNVNFLTIADPLQPVLHRRVVQYSNQVDNLRFGVFYGASSPRNGAGLDLTNPRKNVWGAGAIYTQPIAEQQQLKLSAGFTREHWQQREQGSQYQTSTYALGANYQYHQTQFAIDIEQRRTLNQVESGSKRTENEVRLLLAQNLTDDWRVYAQYGQNRNKFNALTSNNTKEKWHKYVLGSDYWLQKDVVKVFTEFRQDRRKLETNDRFTRKTTDNQTVVGLRVFW